MNSPDPSSTTPDAAATAPIAAAVTTPPAEVAPPAEPPAAAAEPLPAPEPVVPEAPPAAAEEPAQPAPARRPRRRNDGPSDDELAAWNAKVAAYQRERDAERQARAAAKRAAQQAVAERRAQRQAQAAAWGFIHAAVEQAADASEAEAAIDPAYAADELAQRVHVAPEKLRAVIAAVLRANGR